MEKRLRSIRLDGEPPGMETMTSTALHPSLSSRGTLSLGSRTEAYSQFGSPRS